MLICGAGLTSGTLPRLAALTSAECLRLYMPDTGTGPEIHFAGHAPLRVVWRRPGLRIGITHGLPWDPAVLGDND